MKKGIIYLIAMLFIAGCSGGNNLSDRGSDGLFRLSNLKANLEFLASDELEGREAATRGEKIASQYIAAELQKYGVKPFGDSGTFFQNFEVKLIGIDTSTTILFKNGDDESNLKFVDDFVKVHYSLPYSFTETRNKEIVFAGFGITAEEYQYDDYKNIDVNDKIVLVFSGEPYSVTQTFFNGEKTTAYSRISTKISIAKSKGASGVLIIPDEIAVSRWQRYSDRSASKSFKYDTDTTALLAEDIPAFMLSENVATLLLVDQEISFSQLKNKLEKNEFLSTFSLKGNIDFNVVLKTEIANVRNVVGIIEGTDADLKNQYISIGAHYDHEGIKGGQIYNGANDNASGTSAVLEIAKAFAKQNQNKRPVVVLFYTAEEKGLVGAKHFTASSNIIDDIIVNINLDMLGSGSVDSIYSVGSGRLSTELFNLATEVNSAATNFIFNYKYDDPNDPERIYFRSDHYQFAKRGIPSVFFTVDDPINYHKPTDDAEHINFPKILKVAKLVYHLGLRISNLDHKLTVDALETSIN